MIGTFHADIEKQWLVPRGAESRRPYRSEGEEMKVTTMLGMDHWESTRTMLGEVSQVNTRSPVSHVFVL